MISELRALAWAAFFLLAPRLAGALLAILALSSRQRRRAADSETSAPAS